MTLNDNEGPRSSTRMHIAEMNDDDGDMVAALLASRNTYLLFPNIAIFRLLAYHGLIYSLPLWLISLFQVKESQSSIEITFRDRSVNFQGDQSAEAAFQLNVFNNKSAQSYESHLGICRHNLEHATFQKLSASLS